MMKTFHRFSAVFLATILALTLSGCTNSTYERRGDASSTLYVGKVAPVFPTSYMPWMSRDGIAPQLSGMLFETLLTYHESTDSFEPQLCKSWYYIDKEGKPILTPDGKVDYGRLEQVYGGNDTDSIPVRFELDDNITWSDGQKLTAEDVYFTFDLAANQALSNHAGALVWTNDLLHKYQNGKLKRQGIFTYDHGANEAGYKITEAERNTVFYFEVNKVLGAVSTLCSTVLILPKHIYAPIISKDNPINNTSPSKELEYAYKHPVGSGPFELDVKSSNSQQIVIQKRKDYHLKNADGGDLYNFDTIKFILYQDANVAVYALKKGHLDVLMDPIPSNYGSLFEDDKEVSLLKTEGIYNQCLVLNINPAADHTTTARERLRNPQFRKAIALAVDENSLIKNVLDGMGTTVSSGLIKENAEFYNEKSNILPTDAGQRIIEANKILDELYPNKDQEGYRLDSGKRLTYDILSGPAYQDLVSYLQVLFQKIGIEVRYAAAGASPENTYLYVNNFDMTIQGLSLSASNMDIMYNAHFVNLTRSSNYGRLMNSEFKKKIEKMRTTLNRDKKYELASELQVMTAEQFYKIPLYRADILSVARTDRFSGWVAGEAGDTAFNTTSLEKLKKIS